MEIDELIRELKMDLKDYMITMLADDETFNLAFNYINFEELEKVVPKEYLLMRFDNLNKRGLIKKLDK